MTQLGRFWIAVLTAFFLLGCDSNQSPPRQLEYTDKPKANQVPVYRFAVHPLHNPRTLLEVYQPLITYLNQHLDNAQIELEASRDYQAYEAKIEQSSPEFILPNPWQTLQAMDKGYYVIAMAGDAEDFKGIFIVRKDSGITQPMDLKGRTVSYPSHTALAAAIMPQYFLNEAGLDVKKEIKHVYVGSQESAIMNAYLGHSAVGVTWPPPWRLFQKEHPETAEQLHVIWQTEPLMNNSVMARDDVPPELVDRVQTLLLNLHEAKQGADILAAMETARFHQADDQSYQKVREYIQRFEHNIRPVKQP